MAKGVSRCVVPLGADDVSGLPRAWPRNIEWSVTDPGILAKLAGAAAKILAAMLALVRRRGRGKLVFVEQPMFSGWGSAQDPKGHVIQVRLHMTVTNDGEDMGLIVARVCLRRSGLTRMRDWQECFSCQIGEDHLMPGSAGLFLEPLTSAPMMISHIHRVPSPPSHKRPIRFLVCAQDESRRWHRARVKLKHFGE